MIKIVMTEKFVRTSEKTIKFWFQAFQGYFEFKHYSINLVEKKCYKAGYKRKTSHLPNKRVKLC
jgi:hypothetical protein